MEIIEKNLTINYEKLEYGNDPERIIWHHIEAANATIEDVNQWHLNKGWSCIGYNFYVRKNGAVFKGRPIEAIGAHCIGQNHCSIGIAFEGDFMSETMEEAQINAGIELTTYLKYKYGIKEVGGHKEYGDTNCPGDNFPLHLFKAPSEEKDIDTFKNKTYWLQVLCNQLDIKDQSGDPLIEDGILGKRSIYAIKNLPVLKLNNGNAAATMHIQNILKITPDGIYGKETEEVVKMWQASHGIDADGIVGPITWLSFA